MPSVRGGLTILMATVAGALGGMLVGSPWGVGAAGRAAEPTAPLAARVTSLEERLATVLALTPHLSVVAGELDGLAGPHVILEGVNLHLRSGGGATDDGGALTGLGNLVIGYNEPSGGQDPGDRGGSHNLVVGIRHRYLSWGGFVAGYGNFLSGPASSVSGGQSNAANGEFASVSGGFNNAANGIVASVSGGDSNRANGNAASVSGGFRNTADGIRASVSGGATHTASNTDDWRAGLLFQDN